MSGKLSPEARRARYEYNKKYMDAYWERRSRKTEIKTTETSRLGRTESKTVKRTIEFNISMPELEIPPKTLICREGKTDGQYIKALEISNRTLAGENRRLCRLLTEYQRIIEMGVRNVMFNELNSNQI